MKLREFFFDTSVGWRRYVLRMWPVALIPSLLVAGLLAAFGALETSGIENQVKEMGPGGMLLFVLILAPIIETLLLAGMLWLTRRVVRSALAAVAICAVVWGLLHLGNGLTVPFAVTWPFFVFGCAYIAWRPHGWFKAISASAAIHFLQNLLPAFAMLFLPEM